VSARDGLTDREREVLRCLARGLDDKTGAKQLGIQVSTFRTHLRGAMRSLGANTRSHAVALFVERKTRVST
jgi:DNA-binding CsgD family transcriptional regulator